MEILVEAGLLRLVLRLTEPADKNMHEVSIMAEAVRMAVESAQAAGAQRITGLRLSVGALSGVVPDALQFAFEAVSAGTLAEHAVLTIDCVPARFWCETCQQEFAATQLFAECPQCNRSSHELRAGRELALAAMEIE